MRLNKLTPVYSGKVRELYDIGKFNGFDALLIVSTDRISCFDFILRTPIPGKGIILNKMSNFWFARLKNVVENHILKEELSELDGVPSDFIGRSVIVKKAKRINIECVVRGYLSGSAWRDYKNTGSQTSSHIHSVCGIRLPAGLKESDKLPVPIFTPATKEEKGKHDKNICLEKMAKIVTTSIAEKIKDLSIALYKKASGYAESRGIIIADTKFEFGTYDGNLILIDEAITPDSSRLWDASKYCPGKPQESFDKQFVRDYLVSAGWDMMPPAPELPAEIVEETQKRYREIYNRVKG